MKTHIIDASGKRLGKLATEVAVLLKGKNKPTFTPNVLNSDKVVIVNTNNLDVDGKKSEKKMYHRYSGYPGGITTTSLKKLFQKDSREVIRKAVYGMLPKNKLRAKMLNNLEMYKNDMPSYRPKEN